MKLLEEKILAEGIAESENILKVDSFINHQVDPEENGQRYCRTL